MTNFVTLSIVYVGILDGPRVMIPGRAVTRTCIVLPPTISRTWLDGVGMSCARRAGGHPGTRMGKKEDGIVEQRRRVKTSWEPGAIRTRKEAGSTTTTRGSLERTGPEDGYQLESWISSR